MKLADGLFFLKKKTEGTTKRGGLRTHRQVF